MPVLQKLRDTRSDLAYRWDATSKTLRIGLNIAISVASALGISNFTDYRTATEHVIVSQVSLADPAQVSPAGAVMRPFGTGSIAVSLTPLGSWSAALLLATCGFAALFAAALQLLLSFGAPLRGRKVEVRLHVQSARSCHISTSYEELSTLESAFRMPTDMVFAVPSTKGHTIMASDLAIVGPNLELRPRPPAKFQVYSGEVAATNGQRGPLNFSLQYQVHDNFALCLQDLQRRYGADETNDDWTWSSVANWDEVVIEFIWPPHQLHAGAPTVETRRMMGENWRGVPPSTWEMDATVWRLRARNVVTGQSFKFSWPLVLAPQQEQVGDPPQSASSSHGGTPEI
jgi:hypothetical protein